MSMAKPAPKVETVKVTVDYLPATQPFHGSFSEDDTIEIVRTAAMQHFGVRDRQERDTYKYWLHFRGQRITDTSQSLGQVIGEHRKGVKFDLVEEITPGGSS